MNTSEKVHPSTKKPPTIPTTVATVTNKNPINPSASKTAMTTAPSPKLPSTKPQQLQTAPRYQPRPQPPLRDHHHRRRRGCCTFKCWFFTILWATFIIIALLVLAAVTAAVFYAVYRPRPPSFSLSSFKIAELNLSSPAEFSTFTKINLSVITKNPNDKITFFYKPINLTLLAHKGSIDIGQGYFPAFVHSGQNTTILSATITNNNIADSSFGKLQNDLMQKNGKFLKLQIIIQTEVRVKIGDKLETNYVGVKAICGGIKVNRAKDGNFSSEIVDDNCSVHLFIILYDWEIPI